ncbi:hypothetical protein BOX15_Mlig001402g1 [Macrostomum lignano]|uniref:Uncharacterized protein n=2 Tax=Macrostomum lignano TaxID=282301 RepID=A0A267GW50_9PLAT|nr:hypothetical protein BOX15_Mlig012275g1 [Macrostomum lignano]PAA88864.1 hypothetical protein BOX15_Mlig014972g1 [Macrostomum lignano]PAA90258.1 hypothetical protein BOX15_Mlig001402g1 [Macrostomum lignano]
MTQYIPNLDPELLQTVAEELQSKEALQRKHYFLLEQLQQMHLALPAVHRSRVSHDQICRLANSLLDGTVFDIVRDLREVQHLEEKSLSERRRQLESELKLERSDLSARQAEELASIVAVGRQRTAEERRVRQIHERQTIELERTQADRLKKFDMKIIMELDQKVLTQQSTLEKSGVPGFFVTNSPNDIRTQMILMDFIMRLSQKKPPQT